LFFMPPPLVKPKFVGSYIINQRIICIKLVVNYQ
jgi:hypothetical protein